MRRLALIILISSFVINEMKAQISMNIQNNFGFTLVNVSEAMDIPEYSDVTDEGLVEWNQFNYKGLIQLYFTKKEDISLGTELGINRLYYWEEKFIPPLSSPRWDWGTIWTGQVSGLLKKTIAKQYYVITGASLHIFLNGTGATLGIPLAIGHEIRLSETITLPVEFRVDVIFGNAIPIALGGGVGINYKLNNQQN